MRESSRSPFEQTPSLIPGFDLWRTCLRIGSEAAQTSATLIARTGQALDRIQKSQLEMLRTWEVLARTPNLADMRAIAASAQRSVGRASKQMADLVGDGADTITDATREAVSHGRKKDGAKALRAHRAKRTSHRGRRASKKGS